MRYTLKPSTPLPVPGKLSQNCFVYMAYNIIILVLGVQTTMFLCVCLLLSVPDWIVLLASPNYLIFELLPFKSRSIHLSKCLR